MVGDIACLVVRDKDAAADVRQHLPAPRARAAAAGRYVEQAQHHVPLPRLDLRPARVAEGRTRLPGAGLVPARRARPGRAAPRGLARLGARSRRAPPGQSAGAAVRAVPRRPGRDAGAVRRGLARGGRPAQLRGRRQLEGDRGELPRVLPLPADPPGAVRGHPARLGGQLRPAGRVDRRGHGAARRDGVHVAGRLAGRDAAARGEPDRGRVPAPAAQPAGLRAPGLRDDPPDGAAGPGPDLGRVQLAHAARRRPPRGRPVRWSSGTSPTARTGRRASLYSAVWRAHTSGRGPSPPRRTQWHSSSRRSGRPTARAGSRRDAAGRRARRCGPGGRPALAAGPGARLGPDRDRHAQPLPGAAPRPVRLDRAALGARQPGRRHGHGRLRLRAGPRPLEAGARHPGAARGWARLQHDRQRRVVRRHVRLAAGPPQPAPRRPARHRPLRADQLPGAAEPARVLLRRRRRVRGVARRPRRRLLDRPVGRRPGGGRRRPRARPGRRLRRLLRHLLRAGLRRAPPRPGPQRRPGQRLPGLRRGRLVRHPGAGDALVVRRRLPAHPRLPHGPGPGSCRPGARADRGAGEALAGDGVRRGRPADAGRGRRAQPGGGRVRRDVRAGVLPRAHRGAPRGAGG